MQEVTVEIGKPRTIHRVEPPQEPVPRKHEPPKTAPSTPTTEPLAPVR